MGGRVRFGPVHGPVEKSSRRFVDSRIVVRFCIATCDAVQDLTPSERAQGLRYLDQTRYGVIETTKGPSEDQWKFKPAPDRWSIAEVVEHLAVCLSIKPRRYLILRL